MNIKSIVGLLIMVLLAGTVTAAQWGGRGRSHVFHTQALEEIVEDGDFQDLVDYREETGFYVVPWVENEEDFALWKNMHERMEKDFGVRYRYHCYWRS